MLLRLMPLLLMRPLPKLLLLRLPNRRPNLPKKPRLLRSKQRQQLV